MGTAHEAAVRALASTLAPGLGGVELAGVLRAAAVAAERATPGEDLDRVVRDAARRATAAVMQPPGRRRLLRRDPACRMSPRLLAARADGTIDDRHLGQLQHHLSHCPACASLSALFAAADQAYTAALHGPGTSALPTPPAPPIEAAAPASASFLPEPEPVVPEPVVAEPDPEPVAAEPAPIAPEPEPVAPEPEPVAAQPEPVAPEPEPEPVAAQPDPEPVPAGAAAAWLPAGVAAAAPVAAMAAEAPDAAPAASTLPEDWVLDGAEPIAMPDATAAAEPEDWTVEGLPSAAGAIPAPADLHDVDWGAEDTSAIEAPSGAGGIGPATRRRALGMAAAAVVVAGVIAAIAGGAFDRNSSASPAVPSNVAGLASGKAPRVVQHRVPKARKTHFKIINGRPVSKKAAAAAEAAKKAAARRAGFLAPRRPVFRAPAAPVYRAPVPQQRATAPPPAAPTPKTTTPAPKQSNQPEGSIPAPSTNPDIGPAGSKPSGDPGRQPGPTS